MNQIHISKLKTGMRFKFIASNKTYKVNRFSSNRKLIYYSDGNQEYSMYSDQDFNVLKI